MARFDGSSSRAWRSKRMPTVTKKTGMKKPKPIASSFVRKLGWVKRLSWSSNASSAPAAKEPRITSSPSPSASATHAIMRTMAARTRIWALESCKQDDGAEVGDRGGGEHQLPELGGEL